MGMVSGVSLSEMRCSGVRYLKRKQTDKRTQYLLVSLSPLSPLVSVSTSGKANAVFYGARHTQPELFR